MYKMVFETFKPPFPTSPFNEVGLYGNEYKRSKFHHWFPICRDSTYRGSTVSFIGYLIFQSRDANPIQSNPIQSIKNSTIDIEISLPIKCFVNPI